MSPRIQQLYNQIRALDPSEREELIGYARLLDSETVPVTNEEPWNKAELAELLRHEPRSTKTLIEDGLIGAWADLPGIKDGAIWADDQRRKRLEKFK